MTQGHKLVLAITCIACVVTVLLAGITMAQDPKRSGKRVNHQKNIRDGWKIADKLRSKNDFKKAGETYQKIVDYMAEEGVNLNTFKMITESMVKFCEAMPVDVKNIKDGVYKGTSRGFSGDITVAVKVSKGRIRGVAVTDQKESRPLRALEVVPPSIVKKQSPSVDCSSGATITAYAVMDAARLALQSGVSSDADTKDDD